MSFFQEKCTKTIYLFVKIKKYYNRVTELKSLPNLLFLVKNDQHFENCLYIFYAILPDLESFYSFVFLVDHFCQCSFKVFLFCFDLDKAEL